MSMNREDKELLLRYLSMALPYGVILRITNHNVKITTNNTWVYFGASDKAKEHIKPYLRSMSSMTDKEERKRILLGIWRGSQAKGCEVTSITPDASERYDSLPFQNALNFLLENHFDIFGLIPKGLAIEVTEENNPYKAIKE